MMESTSATWNISTMFRRLLLRDDEGPVITPSRPLPPLPMITYDRGLLGLPDDMIHEIFGLLDVDALKSCSLTGKAMSRPVKQILHRTLYLTPRDRPGVPREPNTPGQWNEFKGLPVLGERGLLQHTRHLSVFLRRNPLFPHDLRPHVQYLRALTNLRSLKTLWLDIPSFNPRMEEYFGAFLESLQSLELESPRGDHNQILYFICQFPNLRDLKIKDLQNYVHSMRCGGPRFDIKTSPPLDGTLELQLNTERNKGAQFVLNSLINLPSGLKFRTLKLSECSNPKPLVDACEATLEHVDLTWYWFGETQAPRLSFKRHPVFKKLEIKLVKWANMEFVAAWLSETLSTVTSNVFTELIIHTASGASSFHTTTDNQVLGWNSVDDVLDRLSLCEDVTLVVRPENRVIDDKFKALVEAYFPLMWENERVVLEGSPPYEENWADRRVRVSGYGQIY